MVEGARSEQVEEVGAWRLLPEGSLRGLACDQRIERVGIVAQDGVRGKGGVMGCACVEGER